MSFRTANTLELSILKVGYIAKSQELIVRFNGNPVKGYDTLRFSEVPADEVREFRAAKDREQFFEENIRHNYKYCATVYELYEIFFNREVKQMSAEDRNKIIEELKQAHILKSVDDDDLPSNF